MAKSSLKFTFLRDAIDLEHISFTVFDVDGVLADIIRIETWTDGIAALKKVVTVITQAPYTLPAGHTVVRYHGSLQRDYGTGIMSYFVDGNEITLTITSETRWGFKDVVVNAPDLANFVIVNEDANPMTIVSETLETDNNSCNTYKLTTETSLLAETIDVNGIISPNSFNPVSLTLTRDIYNVVKFYDANQNEVESGFNPMYFASLSAGNITVDVVTDQSGGTATITVSNAEGLVLEYSLDNVVWQSENVFAGLPLNDYTAYVRDQYGCVAQKDFSVTETGTRDPFHFVSKANSITYILQEETSSCGVPKNDENTFAFQNIALLPSCTQDKFQTCDKIKTQFKSNYDLVSALVRSEVGVETQLGVTKMSSNINRFESMDCTIYDFGNNQTGIYFTSGNLYDQGWVPNGDTYTLNGNLPDFAVIGNVITLENIGTFEIVRVLFDNSPAVKKRVIVINNQYTGNHAENKIACTYDLLPYEVYEFEIDWSLFMVGIYEVEIKMDDSENGILYYKSENISLAVEHPGTVRIDYYNTNNRDIFYRYGIEHRVRIPFISIKGIPKGEEEINLTDTGSYVVDSNIYEADEIMFDYMVKSLMRKVSIALGCEYVFVNGVGYVGDGSVEFESIGQTNLYSVSKSMVKTSISYTTRHTGNTGVPEDYINFNIPSIIAQGEGFIQQ
jgi:hypothetical protein